MTEQDAIILKQLPHINKPGNGQLSKLQRQFNQKVQQVDALKQQLAEMRARLELAQNRVTHELRPLVMQVVQKRVELVKLLDRAYQLEEFRKREKDKIAGLIVSIAFSLMEGYEVEELIPLHNKYAAIPYAELLQQKLDEARARQQEPLNFETLDMALEDELDLEHLEAHLEQQQSARENAKAAGKANRGKSTAKLAKEERKKLALLHTSKASRRVYTDLAKLLHPDKELDEAARIWKTEAMKRITHAYKQDDFFELLRLQLQYKTGPDKELDQVPDAQLKYFLKLLSLQAKELEEEQEQFLNGPDSAFYQQYCSSPKQMEHGLGTARNELKRDVKQLKHELKILAEPAYLRAYLKQVV
ncbi:J domain-containing protein [Pontibacter sp. CAU 1760]